jgi:DNA-binding MarR family transcriptional regulator
MLNKAERFEKFILLIDSVHKQINKIKQDVSPCDSVKSVHTMWLYELLRHPEGMTAAEIASTTGIDRSLVSREIRALIATGLIEYPDGEAGGYNSRIVLTDEGEDVARKLCAAALDIQAKASACVSAEELCTFYSVLSRINASLSDMSNKKTNNKIKDKYKENQNG